MKRGIKSFLIKKKKAVSRRFLTAAARVRAPVNPVRFVVDKVALGQVFL
jgi:hypothetical protein